MGHTLINIFSPQFVWARVVIEGGSAVDLASLCDSRRRDLRSPDDYTFLARAYLIDQQYDEALKLVAQALEKAPNLLPAIVLRATILGRLERWEESKAVFLRALSLDPNGPESLNAYAWFVATTLPHPSSEELREAHSKAERAVRIRPAAVNYDTLGWVNYKLGDYTGALEALLTAKSLQERASQGSSWWQEIHYHLGHMFLKLKRRAEAAKAFQEVITYANTYPPSLDSEKYAREAKQYVSKGR